MAALSVQELVLEGFPVWIVGFVFHDNRFVVVADLVDDVFDFLGELELVVGGYALWCYGDTGEGRSVGIETRRMLRLEDYHGCDRKGEGMVECYPDLLYHQS